MTIEVTISQLIDLCSSQITEVRLGADRASNQTHQLKSNSIMGFIAFIERLVEINKGKRLAIVMDNLAAHKTVAVKDKMRELGISWILVVPYSPQFNAIELPFGQIKKRFKELKL